MKLFLNAIGIGRNIPFLHFITKSETPNNSFLNVFLTKSLIKISKKGAPIFKTIFYMAMVLEM